MSQTKKHCEPLVAVWLRPSTTEPCICCKQVAEKPRGENLKKDVCMYVLLLLLLLLHCYYYYYIVTTTTTATITVLPLLLLLLLIVVLQRLCFSETHQ